MSEAEKNELALLRAENARLKASNSQLSKGTIKLIDSGYIQVSGVPGCKYTQLGLTVQGWERIFAAKEEIMAFLKANATEAQLKSERAKQAKLLAKAGAH